MPFPHDFVWGAASSAYQIEGSWDADGKGPSNWDAFTHGCVPAGSVGDLPGQVYSPRNVFMDQTGDVACDHYNRYREDVGLMKQIGLHAYRFSISWPRVMPDGTGAINERGLAFYDRLVDELLAAKIEPWVTLFHWDLPLMLWERGAWLNREIPGWFAEYAGAVADRLSDRVTHWMTLNEPQIFLGPSESEGLQTSNGRRPHAERLLAAHNALLAHGRAVSEIRRRARRTPRIGWAPIGRVKVPATDSTADMHAARAATLSVTKKDFWNNTWFADPAILGRYPEDGLRLYHDDLVAYDGGRTMRMLTDGSDLAVINQPLDFYGVNIYDAERVRMSEHGRIEKVDFPPGHPRTAIRWFIEPEALYHGPKFLYERYRVPIVITENGCSCTDWPDLNGIVRDPQRIDYTRRYLLALERAIDEGTDVRGYFHWSIMDNFEWSHGYNERFGLIHVDYATQKRTLKDSARWYGGVIRSNGKSLRGEKD